MKQINLTSKRRRSKLDLKILIALDSFCACLLQLLTTLCFSLDQEVAMPQISSFNGFYEVGAILTANMVQEGISISNGTLTFVYRHGPNQYSSRCVSGKIRVVFEGVIRQVGFFCLFLF